ncbi:acyltransferase family protein [bacterium]|nr:acyltransferase family protein [bacterium]
MSKKLHIRNQLHHHDPDFINRVKGAFKVLEKYFRYQVVGLENIPKNTGCLLVMNHGIIPWHGFLLAKKMMDKGIYPRGLGAGFLFDIPLVREFFLKSGAVNANPKNAQALLKQKQIVMLAPGGIYEGLVCQPGMKRIPWERRKGFVKLACDAGVPIVPSNCPAVNDVYDNSTFLLKLRIKILEATRFSLPLFHGIGLLPYPKKLTHYVGKPIPVTPKKGESKPKQVLRIHKEVIRSMKELQDMAQKSSK